MRTNKLNRQQRAKRRAAAMEARANTLCIIYYQMGLGRSLKSLFNYMTSVGLKTSLNTLKRYSAKYNWQEKVLEMNKDRQKEQEIEASKEITEANRVQASFGKALIQTAMVGLGTWQEKIKNAKNNLKVGDILSIPMTTDEMLAMAAAGVKMQRIALGQETDKKMIIMQVNNNWSIQISAIFLAINSIQDEKQRKIEFAHRLDALYRDQYQIAEAMKGSN